MSQLTINGWRVPVRRLELVPFEIGERGRAVDGTPLIQRRAVKRRWRVDTTLLDWANATSLWKLVQGMGHQFLFNGSTSPQDTTGGAQLKSEGGLVPTNTPTHTLERSTAEDTANVEWSYSTLASRSPTAFSTGAYYGATGHTNLLSANSSNAEDSGAAGYTAISSAVTSTTTHKWQGSRSIQVATSNLTPNEGVRTDAAVTVAATVYAASVYIKCATGAIPLDISLRRSDTNANLATAQVTTVANTWVRAFVQATAATVGTYLRITTQSQQSLTFYCDGFQISAQSSMPAFTDVQWVAGGSSLAASVGPAYSTTALTNLTSCTISAWVRSYTTSSQANIVWLAGSSSDSLVLYVSSGTPKFFASRSGASVTSTGTTTLTAASTWYHLCGVFDAVNLTVKIYVNGTQEASNAWSGSLPDFSSPTFFRIGSHTSFTTQSFAGGIDNVIVLPYPAPSGLVTALASSTYGNFSAFPKLSVAGDAFDGTVTCVGNVTNGAFMNVSRGGSWSNNNFALSFELEEV
jgi:hypothetical protein